MSFRYIIYICSIIKYNLIYIECSCCDNISHKNTFQEKKQQQTIDKYKQFADKTKKKESKDNNKILLPSNAGLGIDDNIINSSDKYNLKRFIDAQNLNYEKALQEIKSGRKKSCWIWYIFPQIAGLGYSETSKIYEFKSIDEVIEYLKNNTLRNNLIEITKALIDNRITSPEIKLEDIFTNTTDVLKFKSSMTLFDFVFNKYCNSTLKNIKNEFLINNGKNIFDEALEFFCNKKRDNVTIQKISNQK